MFLNYAVTPHALQQTKSGPKGKKGWEPLVQTYSTYLHSHMLGSQKQSVSE